MTVTRFNVMIEIKHFFKKDKLAVYKTCVVKVENILKSSLNSTPSPTVQKQNIARNCRQTYGNKKFVDITQQCLALLPQLNFPANNLNFH